MSCEKNISLRFLSTLAAQRNLLQINRGQAIPYSRDSIDASKSETSRFERPDKLSYKATTPEPPERKQLSKQLHKVRIPSPRSLARINQETSDAPTHTLEKYHPPWLPRLP